MAEEKLIGKITHYFGNIGVGVIELSGALKVGDKIHIKGGTTDFEQAVDSMQVEHQNIDTAKAGDAAGLKVADKVRTGDEVYQVIG